MIRLAALSLLMLASGCTSEATDPVTPSSSERAAAPAVPFSTVLQNHLDAIQNRDLDALMATVTTGDSLALIFPDGTLIETREGYRDIHPGWFADTTWTMTFEPVTVYETPDVALALVKWTITDDTPRSGRQAYLTLTFANEDGTWRLVHDQNTAITPPEEG